MRTKTKDIFKENGFINGGLISFSKTLYRKVYPDNEVIFNCHFYIDGENEPIIVSDIDLTENIKNIQKVCNSIKKNIYLLRESDTINNTITKENTKKFATKIITPVDEK